jgi:ankyrin repeat protein
MHAAHDNQPVIVRMLLSHGAQPNIANNEGETALILAADNNHYVITQLLLEHGAAIDAKSKLGWTALMYAAAKGHRLTVEALLNNGANPNVRDNDGQTASAYALRQGTVPSLGDYPFTSVSVQTRIDRVVAAKQRWLKRHEYREIASLLEQAERK